VVADRLVVVPHAPRRRLALLALVVAVPVMLAAGGFWLGLWGGTQWRESLLTSLEQARKELSLQSQRILALEQQLSIMSMEARVARQANEQVRQQLKEEQVTNAGLREKVRLYQGLMTPENGKSGLDIHSLRLGASEQPGRVRLVVILQQLTSSHPLLTARVDVAVVGRLQGKEVALSLESLAAGDPSGNQVKFRYYVEFERELALPAGFQPVKVEVSARTTGANPQQVEQAFDWVLQGA